MCKNPLGFEEWAYITSKKCNSMILPNSILLQSLSDSIYHEMSSKILKDFI